MSEDKQAKQIVVSDHSVQFRLVRLYAFSRVVGSFRVYHQIILLATCQTPLTLVRTILGRHAIKKDVSHAYLPK